MAQFTLAKADQTLFKNENLDGLTSPSDARDNLELGTAAQVDTGTGLSDVPTGQDLADGMDFPGMSSSSSSFVTARRILKDSGDFRTNTLLILGLRTPGEGRSVLSGFIHGESNLSSSENAAGATGIVSYAQGGDSPDVIASASFKWSSISISNGSAATNVARLVIATIDGSDYICIELNSNRNPNNLFFTGILNTDGQDSLFLTGTDKSNASSIVPLPGEEQFSYGAPGDPIGDNGALRNTNQSLGEATDFPVEEGTWTPVAEGNSTAGSHTYSTQEGFYKRHGDLVYISGRVNISSVDGSAGGNLIITGLPFTELNASRDSVSVGRLAIGAAAPTDFLFLTPLINSAEVLCRYVQDTGSETGLNVGEIGDGFTLYFSGIYRI